MVTHNKVYGAGLALFALFNVMLIINGVMELNLVGRGWDGPVGVFPAWAVPWLALLLVAYTLVALVILFLRRQRPELGRRLTRFFNWALLPVFPAGTLLGIYGLGKMDRVKFDLDAAIADWRRQRAVGGDTTAASLDELELRLREEMGDQMWSWKSGSEERAFARAARRLTNPDSSGVSIWEREMVPGIKTGLAKRSAQARQRQKAFGWVAGGIVFPGLTLGFLFGFDQIELRPAEVAAVFAVAAAGLLLHFATWRGLHRRLSLITRRRALRTIQRGCIGLSLIFALLSCYIILPGLNFSGPVTVETATYLKSTIPSIPAWCLCYALGAGSLTICCGLEEAVDQQRAIWANRSQPEAMRQ